MAQKLKDIGNSNRETKYVGGLLIPVGHEYVAAVGASGTIATTGNSDFTFVAPHAGVLTKVWFSGKDALAANDINYVTFSITNKGAAGAGSTAMLLATAANTTQATGGSATAAYTARSLSLHGTAANLVVAAGDTLLIRVAATGTLANSITFAAFMLKIRRTA